MKIATFATAKPWTQRADAPAKTVVVQGSEMQTAGATVHESADVTVAVDCGYVCGYVCECICGCVCGRVCGKAGSMFPTREPGMPAC